MHMCIYLGIYVGKFWKFHSNNVICIELLACNKTGVDRNEYNLHYTFPLAPLDFLLVQQILGHIILHDFPMYHIPCYKRYFLYVCLLCCIYMYCMATKRIHCHCHCHCPHLFTFGSWDGDSNEGLKINFELDIKQFRDTLFLRMSVWFSDLLCVLPTLPYYHNLAGFRSKSQLPKSTQKKTLSYRTCRYNKWRSEYKRDVFFVLFHVGYTFDGFDYAFWFYQILLSNIIDSHEPVKRKRTVENPLASMNSRSRKEYLKKPMLRKNILNIYFNMHGKNVKDIT